MARKDGGGIEVVRAGLLGRSGAGACPNLLQRRPAAGSAAIRSAEYQRFSSRTPEGSRPLQQIWTNGAAVGPCTDGGLSDHPAPRPPCPAPGRRDVHFALERALLTAHLECKMHLSRAECTSRRSQDRPVPHHPGRLPPTPSRADPGPQTTTPGEQGSMSLSHRGSCWSVMMRSAGRRREDARRPPFRVIGPRRPQVRPRPR